jgi:hypothetical protein
MPCLALIPFTAEQSTTIQVLILRGAFHAFHFYRYGFMASPQISCFCLYLLSVQFFKLAAYACLAV